MAKKKVNPEDLEIFEVVPQAVLLEVLRMQDRLVFLQNSVKASLQKGSKVEEGICGAEIRKTLSRRPAWKEVAEKLMTPEQIAEVIANTPPTESESLHIEVKKGAMAPEAPK